MSDTGNYAPSGATDNLTAVENSNALNENAILDFDESTTSGDESDCSSLTGTNELDTIDKIIKYYRKHYNKTWQFYALIREFLKFSRKVIIAASPEEGSEDVKTVELHVHLDGAVRLSTIWELAQKKGIELCAKSMEDLYDGCRIKCPTTLKKFLEPFSIFLPVIVGDPEAIERIAYEFCEDAAKQCVLYCEVRYCPHLLSTMYGPVASSSPAPLTPREVVMCVNRGLSRGSAEFKITVRSILCCFRGHSEWSDEILDLCSEFHRQGVVGIDIAGDEALEFASSSDIDVFKKAASQGIHRTVHAGEDGPASNVRTALVDMFAERIGHGYHVVNDPRLYSECRLWDVHFEACPYSSCLTGAVPGSCSKHPIVRFAEDGVKFSINRDDPTLIQKTLDDEYEFLRGFGLKEVHIVRANFNAAAASFLPADEKQLLMQQLREIYGTEPTNVNQVSMEYIPPKAMSGGGDA